MSLRGGGGSRAACFGGRSPRRDGVERLDETDPTPPPVVEWPPLLLPPPPPPTRSMVILAASNALRSAVCCLMLGSAAPALNSASIFPTSDTFSGVPNPSLGAGQSLTLSLKVTLCLMSADATPPAA
jgi:hypothetical protein